jgi:hypothetical protein
MAIPVFGDPLAYLVAMLQAAFPTAIVTSNPQRHNEYSKVDSDTEFILVQDQGGNTPSFLHQTNVRFEVISYTHRTNSTAPLVFAQRIQRAIYTAAYDQLVFAGGHCRRPQTLVRPYVQALHGLPTEITRCTGTYSIGYRSR